MRRLSDFDPRRNSLNVLRLVLASLVIVSHAWPIAGVGNDPAWRGAKLGTLAVYGFFSISGYLIVQSRLHLGGRQYLWHRFLRIVGSPTR